MELINLFMIKVKIRKAIATAIEIAKLKYNGTEVSTDFISEINTFIGSDATDLVTEVLNNINGKLYE